MLHVQANWHVQIVGSCALMPVGLSVGVCDGESLPNDPIDRPETGFNSGLFAEFADEDAQGVLADPMGSLHA